VHVVLGAAHRTEAEAGADYCRRRETQGVREPNPEDEGAEGGQARDAHGGTPKAGVGGCSSGLHRGGRWLGAAPPGRSAASAPARRSTPPAGAI